ncbi:hypothetical protein FBEOM_4266 [Fusarium beomiforme]|uniref:Xylanolytic transcriptional activator regulatory domain-containing protein n=1 Tax=Fusarium beomiforme TaxID=44412 RepID=A0A9P5ANL9_9HYPO|nr:hypothetical protein FBEOM_4266 [Fusarium beomiforme]
MSHWTDRPGTLASFIVQMLLVAATAANCHPEVCIDIFSQKTVHDHVIEWIEASEAWLNSPANQPPRSWDILASQCLLLIAKRANYIKEGSFWTYTGTLVRWAMAAGYHREVVSATRISPFWREMRRRLWATIIELDLQVSIERGMPTSVRIEDFNIKCPLNIDDKTLQESMRELPTGMSVSTLTNSSFQSLLYRSLPTRMKIYAFINGCFEQEDFDRILQLEEELGQALRDIPTWDNSQADPRQHQTATYIKNTLGIMLHQRVAHESEVLDQSTTITVFPEISTLLVATVEKVLQILEKRISLTFNGLNEYYILSMTIGLVKSRLWPESSTRSDKEAAERVIKICTIMEKRQASLRREQSLTDSFDDGASHRNDLSVDASYMVSDTVTDFISSMLPQDLEFLSDNFDLTFFHA